MANRGVNSFDEFKSAAEKSASLTLAYHLASDELKPAVTTLFLSVAEYLQQQEPNVEKQATYSKTLLGMKSAKEVEQWVIVKRELLLTLTSNENWLAMIWNDFPNSRMTSSSIRWSPVISQSSLRLSGLKGAPTTSSLRIRTPKKEASRGVRASGDCQKMTSSISARARLDLSAH